MAADFVPSEGQPLPYQAGTSILVEGYLFDDGGVKALQVAFRMPDDYASGGTVSVPWFGQTATTGDVALGCSVKAVTANTDDVNVESLAWATETVAVDSHLGTTAKRPHSVDVAIGALDSVAAGDWLFLRIRRHGGVGGQGDTYADDIVIQDPIFTYTAS